MLAIQATAGAKKAKHRRTVANRTSHKATEEDAREPRAKVHKKSRD